MAVYVISLTWYKVELLSGNCPLCSRCVFQHRLYIKNNVEFGFGEILRRISKISNGEYSKAVCYSVEWNYEYLVDNARACVCVRHSSLYNSVIPTRMLFL